MSSYGSAHSGQLHPGYQTQSQQHQRTRSYSNPPYPTTPGPTTYPQRQQQSYFPPPPTARSQQAPPTSNPITIPASNRKRASSEHAFGYGTSPSYQPPSSPYSNSYPTHHLQPIPQVQPIPENYQYPPQQQQGVASGSPAYEHHRRRSSLSQYGYDPRRSYESAHSWQSAHSQQSPDYYARHAHHGHGHHGNQYYVHNNDDYKQATNEPPSPKGYGDWDKDEVSKYQKNQDLERRPTLGGSLMSFVKKFGGSERR